MSIHPSTEFQTALYTLLAADSALAALVGTRIYDNPAQDAVLPHVEIGDDTYVDRGDHVKTGTEATITLHTWSREAGRKQCRTIMDRLYALLHQGSLSMSTHQTVIMRCEFDYVQLDPDGLTHHGIQRFRVITRRI